MKQLASAIVLAAPWLLAAQHSQTIEGNPNWILVPPHEVLTSANFFDRYSAQLGIASDDMILQEEWADRLGTTHYRFDQHHLGLPVDGAQFILHESGGRVVKGNGRLVKGISGSPVATVSSEEALQRALSRIDAKSFLWQSEAAESQLRRIRNDPNASYFPTPGLVWFDKGFSQDASKYFLAWKVEVNTMQPLGRHDVYVDAVTGSVAHVINKSGHTDVPGIAHTKYSGTQSFITDSVAPGSYRLRESSRGNGIETYNMEQQVDYLLAVDFTDADNDWDNVNPQQDEAATDAHWGMEMTYDYYLQKFGRNSLNDSGMTMISYVHYDQNYANAFWNGSFMTFGDGGSGYTAFTALDVVAHEATHGVTQFSANLIYQDEPGALNESFSDIFGAAVEFWATPALGDWLVGEEMGPPLRSMSNPKQFGDPGTYLGTGWVTGPFDNGGVHTNNGVQNHWYYILSEGDTGTNDFGHSYAVSGIGIDAASRIAYRNLTTYLTQSSQYADARLGAIQAAEDLYGPCSPEVVQTSAAWFAVGVGFTMQDKDLWAMDLLSPITACGLSNAETVTARMRYNGCAVPINAGDTIPMAFRVDGGAITHDTLFVSSSINGGDTITFTFDQAADLSTVGTHLIDVWSSLVGDPQPLNDSLRGLEITHVLQQNVDVGVVGVAAPTSSCHLDGNETIVLELEFFGCDSLPTATPIGVGYRVNGGSAVSSSFTLPQTAYPGVPFTAVVTGTSDLSAYDVYTIDAWTAFGPDFLNANDTLFGHIVEKPLDIASKWIRFEEAIAVKDSFYEFTGSQAAVGTHPSAASSGSLGLRMTGGDVLNAIDLIEGIPDGTNNFDLNAAFGAEVCFCVDASAWTSAYLQFDLKQTFSPVYELYLGDPLPDASSFRVKVNGNQLGPIHTPVTTTADPFATHQLDLNAHAGSFFELCFETRCYFHPSFDPTAPLGQGDQSKLDNLIVSRYPVGIDRMKEPVVALYPNPSSGSFTVQLAGFTGGQLEVMDAVGRPVITRDLAGSKEEFTLPSPSSGLYVARFLDDSGRFVGAVPLLIQ
jgi:Zn-dependent metalloprotease